MKFYARGGGTRTFSAFNPGTRTFGFEQYDQSQLKRTSTNSYEMIQLDGSKLVFTNSESTKEALEGSVWYDYGQGFGTSFPGTTSRPVKIGRVRQVIDEKGQVSQFTYNRDNTLNSVAYVNSTVPTPGVGYTYDPNYSRRLSMTDGTGTTLYSYNPVTTTPALGANQLASMNGPFPNDTITYEYDELGRRISTAINGVAMRMNYDAAGRVVSETNALGTFTYDHDGASGRLLTNVFPNGLTVDRGYGGNLEDRELQRITHKVGATPISEFLHGRDHLADRITTWSQQVGATPPSLHAFGYDSADQLISASVTNSGNLINTFAYSYDPTGNRLTEQVGASNYTATYNALNQLGTSTAPGATRTNEWDAKDRLVAVNAGNHRTEFTYDGQSRMVAIRQLTNGSETSFRRLVWCDNNICEERDAAGGVTKRFYSQGMKVESGLSGSNYLYTHDHLGSIRELTDAGGNVRARYSYDPFGSRIRVAGDMEADFGFAGMFWVTEAGLVGTRFRPYDPERGRWLSRDPLPKAEIQEGPNLYAYAGNNPVNVIDPLGLAGMNCCESERDSLDHYRQVCPQALREAARKCAFASQKTPEIAAEKCAEAYQNAAYNCQIAQTLVDSAAKKYFDCMAKSTCDLDLDSCPKSEPDPDVPRCSDPQLFLVFTLGVPAKLGFRAFGGGLCGGKCRP